MVSLVIVSHSAALAEGIVELAREMGGEGVAIEAAGGLEDPPGALGTDAERVMRALETVRSPDGVLVLMDLGSALMSAELAVEMLDGDGGRILLSEGPLVEGAVAAAARARTGATLDEVAGEARLALGMKAEQLGADEADATPSAAAEAGAWDSELRLTIANRLGLHARPAARLVGATSGLQADVSVANVSRARGPVNGRSLSGLTMLNLRQGDEMLVRARGEHAREATSAVEALAADGWGDRKDDQPGSDATSSAGTPEAPPRAPIAPPSAGAQLTGVPASSGIAIGPACPLARPVLGDDDDRVESPGAESARLDVALASTRADLRAARASMAGRAGEDEAAIFDAHLLLLDDVALVEPARHAIENQGLTAGRAWQAAAAAVTVTYRELEDPYLRERAIDVEDVAGRVLGHLSGAPEAGAQASGIVIAGELTPGEAAGLDPARVTGIATARGGATSHAAILARALGIPAVVGLGDPVLGVAAGTMLVLDGDTGQVSVDPGEAIISVQRERRAHAEAALVELRRRAGEPGRMRDGHRVEVLANLGSPQEVSPAITSGAEGVGLLRTEFLFLGRSAPPGEDEQAAVYREIAEGLGGRPLVLRTLDAGADKPLPFLTQTPEDNPFLGLRGIRLSLREPELLRTQLRAALRVAAHHPLKIMFPMVSTLAEYRAARALLEEEASDLGRPPGLEVGVMVEVPAVALAAERFAREVDFFSVGTNDLAQYTMAAERGNEHVAGLLAGPLPPVLALIAAVVAGAEAHGRWVGVCGELAGEPGAAVLLAGLGVKELSMAAGSIPRVKHALRQTDLADAREAARRALEAESAKEAASFGSASSSGS